MVKAVVMPKLGQSEETVKIVQWRKQLGETVAKGDILFEIETDKAVLEVESFYAGTLLKIVAGEGVTVPVQATVAFVGDPGEPVPEVVLPPVVPKKAEAARPSARATTATRSERRSADPLTSRLGGEVARGPLRRGNAARCARRGGAAVVPHQPSRRETGQGIRHRSHAHCGHGAQRANRGARCEAVS